MVASRAEQAAIGRVDVAVYSRSDELQLVVEVKSKPATTVDWAANMRRNLTAHLAIPPAPFFLLVSLDRFYLWKNVASPLEVVPPDYDIDSAPFLAAYIGGARHVVDTISDYGLTLAVSAWLSDLVNSDLDVKNAPPHQAWLHDSGLYRAIRGGTVTSQATP
jgi:hypothetical protein